MDSPQERCGFAIRKLSVSTSENLLQQRLGEQAASWFICVMLWDIVLVGPLRWSRVQTRGVNEATCSDGEPRPSVKSREFSSFSLPISLTIKEL